MASSAKRRQLDPAVEESRGSGTEEESGDSSEESEPEIHQEVQVDFEAHAISDNDHNGIKRLLQQLFLKASINIIELANIIIQQNHVGSVIRQAEILDGSNEEDDEDDIFGFITAINLTERKGMEPVEQIKELVLSQCETHHQGTAEQLDKILNDNSKPVSFLISERFINVPPQISLPLHKQLQTELMDARKTNKSCGKSHYYLMISKTCMEAGKKKVPQQKGKVKEELRFINAEEEFFYEQSVITYSYSVQEESDSSLSGRWSFDDVPMKPLRTVMLIPADRINAIMNKLEEYLTI
ncbi:protein BCCIP homolog isoform X1 [Stegostoma tigrinum]|uniref:protein BCCIP homolog isoform X1 n=1 Tax=Stegostoma tigrinum TaxID=3053191 RepID=UPI00202B6469|nr:protein BCCIP homolog isoform X1 [Stegostoma tigrinum]